MKTKSTTIVLLLAAVMFLASCGSNQSENANTSTEQTVNEVYQCPMKCEGEKTYDKPGSCPVCNMDLEKIKDLNEQHDKNHHNH